MHLGQLIITGIEGKILTEEEKSFITAEGVGGIILFARNYESPTQVAELVNSLQALRCTEAPMLISVDHEGGRVLRFRGDHFTQFPSMHKVAAKNSPKLCFDVHDAMAKELLTVGVNFSYSPVCDIFNHPANTVIGDRAFGSDAETVGKFLTGAIRGLQNSGVLACAKHFPGHGCTDKDSHFDLPVVRKSFEELMAEEFLPFRKAIKEKVATIMMAHMLVECIDDSLPCTLSPKAFDLLRRELHFNNLIISDDMEMKAVSEGYGIAEAAVQSLRAGADLLIYNHIATAKKAIDGLKEAFKSKTLTTKDFEEKNQRLIECQKTHFPATFTPIVIEEVLAKLAQSPGKKILAEIMK